MEYTYDSLGRRTGLQLSQNSTTVFANSYTYDSMSRLATVGDGTNTATYSRVAGSNLLNTTTIAQGGNTKLTTTRNYDGLNRLTSISSAAGAVTKTYSYTYDDKDRRSRLDLADGSYWLYNYDTKGQIISGVKYASGGAPIPGQSFSYNYDDIGNLTTEQRGMSAMEFSYTANLVNQYTQRLVPGIIPVTGQASTDSTVSIWLKNHGENANAVIKPTRNGEYFTSLISVDNTTANVSEDLEITAVKFDQAQDKDVVKTITGNYTVPQTPQLFSYDDDGNTLSDGVWAYTYNAENRPVTAINAANTAKLEYAYDYDGRRVSKKIYAKSGTNWTLTKEIKFVYDGNNPIAEFDGNNALLRSCLWGEDIAGTLQETGGIGGLLSVIEGTISYYPAYDGNGNVRACFDNTGALVAEYEYSPSGKPVAYGAKAADLPFQFSTQYYDRETGTHHYKYRDYDPDIMRWLTPDPIGENGGYNLYAMVGNNPVNKWDSLGLRWDITRNGKTYADACSDSPKDTFKDLANLLSLNEEEYKTWANTTDEKPLTAKIYKIPNTFIAQFGPATDWEKNVLSQVIRTLRDIAFSDISFAQSQGLKVITQENVSGVNIRSALKMDGLYIYTYAGHGSVDLRGLSPGMYTRYGIARMSLLACDTADYDVGGTPEQIKKLYPNRKIKYNRWELNVSRLGYFIGFEGSVNLYNATSKLRIIHGARGK